VRIVIGYENFGPYHLARLGAVAEQCTLLAIEFAKKSATYDWAPADTVAFDRVTLEDTSVNNEYADSTKRLEQALSAFSPDVVFVPGWAAPEALAMLRWCRHAGVPTVVMSDSQAIDEPRTATREFVKSRLLGLFDGALVAGSRHRAYLEQLGFVERPIQQPYDVVDNAHFAPPVGNFGAYARSTILCCARLVEKKNLPTLLLAYRRFLERIGNDGEPAPDLVILGEGSLRHVLATQVSGLALVNKVSMPGFVPYPSLPAAYHAARVFVLPSTTEQWGLVVNEAMAAGCPVLVSERAGCVPELVRNGQNGFSFNPTDPEGLAERLLWLHERPQVRDAFGVESRRIIASYGLQDHAAAVLELAARVHAAPSRRYSRLGRFFLSACLEAARRRRTR